MRLRTTRRRAAAAATAAALALVLASPGRAAALEVDGSTAATTPEEQAPATTPPTTAAPITRSTPTTSAPRPSTPTTSPATTAPPTTPPPTTPPPTTPAPVRQAPADVVAQADGISIGDLVWHDLDRDGVREDGEPGIAAVTVRLYEADGTTLVDTTETAVDGTWSFGPATTDGGLAAGTAYVVRIGDAGDVAAGGPLHGLAPTQRDAGSDDALDSDARTSAGSTRIDVAPLEAGASDVDLDAGFVVVPLTLAGRLWQDSDTDGAYDRGEPVVAGATVRVFSTADLVSPVSTTTTSASGHHLTSGLRAGEYVVEVVTGPGTPLQGFISTSGRSGARTGPAEPAGDPDDLEDAGRDGLDVGTQVSPTAVRSLPFTLAVGSEPLFENDPGDVDDPTGAPDRNTNSLADFGFIEPPSTLSLGNRVWRDVDGDGVLDAGEPGIAGVPVRLFGTASATTPVKTTTTDAEGRYLFTDVAPGEYVVELTPPAGFSSSTGVPAKATGPFEPAPDPDTSRTDGRDDGTAVGTVVRSLPVTLAVGAAPTGELDLGGPTDPTPDDSSDLTVDFALVRLGTIGDLVFFDADADGVQDAGELGVADATVELLDAAGTVLATTTTSADGYYAFGGLPAGSYRVRFTPPSGFALTTGDAGSDETADSDPDPTTRTTGLIALAEGQTTLTIDAGIRTATTSTGTGSGGGGGAGVGGTGTDRGSDGLPVTGGDTLALALVAGALLLGGTAMAATGTALHVHGLRRSGARHVRSPLAHLGTALRRAARPVGLTLLGAAAPCLASVLKAGVEATLVTALPASLAVLEAARPGALAGLLAPRRPATA